MQIRKTSHVDSLAFKKRGGERGGVSWIYDWGLCVEETKHCDVTALAAVLEVGRAAASDGGPAGPSAEARRHRDVLLAVDEVADRAADDAGAGLIGPEFLAAILIEGFEFTFGRTGEYQAAAGSQHTAHEGRGRVHGPLLVAAFGIECDELA